MSLLMGSRKALSPVDGGKLFVSVKCLAGKRNTNLRVGIEPKLPRVRVSVHGEGNLGSVL